MKRKHIYLENSRMHGYYTMHPGVYMVQGVEHDCTRYGIILGQEAGEQSAHEVYRLPDGNWIETLISPAPYEYEIRTAIDKGERSCNP